MRIDVHNRCSDFDSYRAARVKSLFNAESGCNFDLSADLPIDDPDWKIGLIVGPSGSGKTSMGRQLWGEDCIYAPADRWPADAPIIDAIAPGGDFDAVTGALAAVGLGSVPSWLRPYAVLSNGERFRADLARIIADAPARIVVDEFTSVVDRQIAKFGALAFQKAWRRTPGQAVLLSCHYDIIEWVEPDWVFDTSTGGSIYWLDDRIDAGAIAAQDWCFVRPEDDAESLWRRELQPMGMRLLGQALRDIARGLIVQIPQDEALATWEPALNPPPIRRPDLPMLGDGRAGHLTVIRSREVLVER